METTQERFSVTFATKRPEGEGTRDNTETHRAGTHTVVPGHNAATTITSKALSLELCVTFISEKRCSFGDLFLVVRLISVVRRLKWNALGSTLEEGLIDSCTETRYCFTECRSPNDPEEPIA